MLLKNFLVIFQVTECGGNYPNGHWMDILDGFWIYSFVSKLLYLLLDINPNQGHAVTSGCFDEMTRMWLTKLQILCDETLQWAL